MGNRLTHTEEPTDAERDAILLRFRMQNPNAPEGAAPTPQQSLRLLEEIRVRQQAIESGALDMLREKTRNPPTYSGLRSKYAQLLFLALMATMPSLG